MTGVAREVAAALALMATLGIVFAAAELAHKRLRLGTEVTRKLGHLAAGLLALPLPLLRLSVWTVLALGLVFFGAIYLLRSRALLQSARSVARATHGELFFPIGVAVTYAACAATDTLQLYPAAIAALAFGDPAAWLAGTTLGKRVFRILGEQRTLEGSLALMLTVALTVFAILTVSQIPTSRPAIAIAIAAGSAAALVEAVSPLGLDNITIPLGTWAALALLL